MDSFTLQVASALVSAIMMISLFLLYRASSREMCLLDWSAAGLLFFLRNCLSVAYFVPQLTSLVSGAMVNALYLSAHAAILVGVRRHLGLWPGWPLVGVLALLVFGLNLMPVVQQSVALRLMLLLPLVLLLCLATLYTLWRAPDPQMRTVYLLMMGIELLFSLQLLVKIVLVALDPDMPLTLAGDELLQTSGYLAMSAFIMLTTMACALIVIRRQELELRRASDTDPLTGWLNRRALQRIASHEFARSDRTGQPCAILTFDIDHFKKINDSYGHAVGDEALKHVTSLAQDVLRGYDYLFRIGGEEFVILLTDVQSAELCAVASRLRRKVLKQPLVHGQLHIPVTVSVGYAQRQLNEDWQTVLDKADRALYHAKEHGRDRVSFYNSHQELEWLR
ncbi:GGDEF domain-containing protein [Rheinheimera sp.]|uniref:GGDEF domain-containing protein n=1 Tax=Rheinheimera sp. TaxID=1869214 RepID=UPI002FDC80F3